MARHTEDVRNVRRVAVAQPNPAVGRWRDLAICLLLLVSTVAVYSQVRSYAFVNYDDPDYIAGNAHVSAGLTAGGIAWAFRSFEAANWFPLTWLTHMADSQFFGLDAGWHHLTNVWIHALDALLLFFVLRRLTAARWPSAFAAFLFALHPLHVESVAWVAERKDVLSAFFWFLTLWFYADYVKRPGRLRYLAVAAAFALGLMSKPMIVTLPFVLLLLDVWPLRRVSPPWSPAAAWRMVIEKLPLFAMAAAGSVLTFLAQRQSGAVVALAGIPLSHRVGNALISYITYIRDMFWPSGLAVLYPTRQAIPAAAIAAAALVLVVISILVARQLQTRPYLAVGWFWYLGTLAPVIGFVQVGTQAHADRYMYVPMIGLSIMLGWGGTELIQRFPRVRNAVAAGAVLACAACLVVTWFQIQYWASSETLYRHTLAVTENNYITRHHLANYYLETNRHEDALREEAEAVRIKPTYLDARLNMALALSLLGRPAEAEAEYRRSLEQRPQGKLLYVAHSGLGAALAAQGRTAEALPELQFAATLKPDSAESHYNLGTALGELGRVQEAAAELAIAVRLRPDDPDARQKLALALAAQGKLNEAVEQFRALVAIRPDDAAAHCNLAIALARAGRNAEAIEHYTEALRLNPDFEPARRGLEIAAMQQKAPASR